MAQRITIIDDDPELLSELKDLLESTGYRTSAFTNPITGFSDIHNSPPDLILLDIKMQELSGIQLAALIRLTEETSRTPIIFMSGNFNQTEIAETMRICSIEHYLEKPVKPDVLLQTIKDVLTKSMSGKGKNEA